MRRTHAETFETVNVICYVADHWAEVAVVNEKSSGTRVVLLPGTS